MIKEIADIPSIRLQRIKLKPKPGEAAQSHRGAALGGSAVPLRALPGALQLALVPVAPRAARAPPATAGPRLASAGTRACRATRGVCTARHRRPATSFSWHSCLSRHARRLALVPVAPRAACAPPATAGPRLASAGTRACRATRGVCTARHRRPATSFSWHSCLSRAPAAAAGPRLTSAGTRACRATRGVCTARHRRPATSFSWHSCLSRAPAAAAGPRLASAGTRAPPATAGPRLASAGTPGTRACRATRGVCTARHRRPATSFSWHSCLSRHARRVHRPPPPARDKLQLALVPVAPRAACAPPATAGPRQASAGTRACRATRGVCTARHRRPATSFSWHSCLSRHARRVHRPPPPARDKLQLALVPVAPRAACAPPATAGPRLASAGTPGTRACRATRGVCTARHRRPATSFSWHSCLSRHARRVHRPPPPARDKLQLALVPVAPRAACAPPATAGPRLASAGTRACRATRGVCTARHRRPATSFSWHSCLSRHARRLALVPVAPRAACAPPATAGPRLASAGTRACRATRGVCTARHRRPATSFSWHSCLSRHARRVHRPPPPARDKLQLALVPVAPRAACAPPATAGPRLASAGTRACRATRGVCTARHRRPATSFSWHSCLSRAPAAAAGPRLASAGTRAPPATAGPRLASAGTRACRATRGVCTARHRRPATSFSWHSCLSRHARRLALVPVAPRAACAPPATAGPRLASAGTRACRATRGVCTARHRRPATSFSWHSCLSRAPAAAAGPRLASAGTRACRATRGVCTARHRRPATSFSWHSCLSRHARRVHRPPPPARD
ncbi:hypothetical protein ACJJTC_002729 [Scirpophaga incertulas]